MYYFYVLQSIADDGYYYGSSTNLKRRVSDHKAGKVFATSYRLPVELVYYEAFLTEMAARLREKQVKRSSSIRAALRKRINS